MKFKRKDRATALRPLLFKYMALLMGICYLANPLQNQISFVFHEVSHLLERPNEPLAHSSFSKNGAIYHHSHEHSDEEHKHSLIDLLDSIFTAQDDGSTEETLLVNIKFDKHTTSDAHALKIPASYKLPSNYGEVESGLKKGHPEKIKEPPRNFSV